MTNKCSGRALCRPSKDVRLIIIRCMNIVLWPARGAATALLFLLPLFAFAQRERSNLISISHTSILDTYLSQEEATGTELRYTWEKTNRKPVQINEYGSQLNRLRHWSSLVTQEAFVTKAGTRGNDNSFIGAMYNLRFGWHYNFDVPSVGVNQTNWANPSNRFPSFNVRLGLLADLSLGGLYNTRNSNNPAQARASLNIDPSVMASWRFNIRNKPFALRYEAAVPVVGIAFSPNYGQSYYEIFTRGNYDHNVVFTSPFSGVQLHQMLTFDFRLWHTTFTVGYIGDIRQMDVNNLKYHQYSHGFLIGWRL